MPETHVHRFSVWHSSQTQPSLKIIGQVAELISALAVGENDNYDGKGILVSLILLAIIIIILTLFSDTPGQMTLMSVTMYG